MQEILLSWNHILVFLQVLQKREDDQANQTWPAIENVDSLLHAWVFSVDTTGNKQNITSTDLFIKQNIVIWEDKKSMGTALNLLYLYGILSMF